MTVRMTAQEQFMHEALMQAREAYSKGEVPVGAVLVQGNQIVAQAANGCEAAQSGLHHAEFLVLSQASQRLGRWRLNDCTLYVTLEPCLMCLGALLQTRVGHLIYGCDDPKRPNADTSTFAAHAFQIPSLRGVTHMRDSNHELVITGGVLANESRNLLKDFFRQRRSG